MNKHVIEILYTERCRFLSVALERVRDVLCRRPDLDVEVRLVLVSSFAEAVSRRFRGSPTVRVDGDDVETRPGAVAPIGLLARGYLVDGHVERAPTIASIEQALARIAFVDRARSSRPRPRAESSGAFPTAPV
jgi:hypothetical protein